MTYFADFSLCTYHDGPFQADNWQCPLLSVGWLDHPNAFPTGGRLAQDVRDRLAFLRFAFAEAYSTFEFRGLHTCSFCVAEGMKVSHAWLRDSHVNLFVPGTESQLPTDDLSDSPAQFYTSRCGDALLGIVGLERHGEVALLRSLAVEKSVRGLGIGTALVRYAERAALTENVRALYLLTNTAEQFFAVLGYQKLPRGGAPASIASTAEFSSLCPTSSVLMKKSL